VQITGNLRAFPLFFANISVLYEVKLWAICVKKTYSFLERSFSQVVNYLCLALLGLLQFLFKVSLKGTYHTMA